MDRSLDIDHCRLSLGRLASLDWMIRKLDQDQLNNSKQSHRIDILVFERQLVQTGLWLRTVPLYIAPSSELRNALQQLKSRFELLVQEKSIRTRLEQSIFSGKSFYNSVHMEDVKTALTVSNPCANRHQKSIEQQRWRVKPDRDYLLLLGNMDLKTLCLMPSDQFDHLAIDAIKNSLIFLLDPSKSPPPLAAILQVLHQPKCNARERSSSAIVPANSELKRHSNHWKLRAQDASFDFC